MKRGVQTSLFDVWSGEKRRKDTSSNSRNDDSDGEPTTVDSDDEQLTQSDSEDDELDPAEASTYSGAVCVVNDCCDCTTVCCSEIQQAYQPNEKVILSLFIKKGRKFLPAWYKMFPWITLCITHKKIFCVYCRFAQRHKLFTFAKKGDVAFSVKGFDNFKKAVQKFRIHENSDSHLEARLKCRSLNNPSINEQLSSEAAKVQGIRRAGLLKQLEAMKFLLRQGIALRGHSEEEGNLYQLLTAWSGDCTAIKSWIEERKYMSHEIVNELITLMGHNILRQLLVRIKCCVPSWYAVIVDEATDVACREQMNLSIRYVDDDYTISEDSVGLFHLPNTSASTLHLVLTDMLLRCNLPLSLCRGQAYDGAAAMQGKRKGLATLIRNEVPAALPVHCLAHSLNLCLQDVGRQNHLLRDAMDIVREIVGLIKRSPKRTHLFNEKLMQSEGPKCGIKPLCPTRWTVRTEAMDAVIKQYSVIMDTMEEVNQTTRDEYGLKAGGILAALEKFEMLFGLKLGHLLFSAAEQTSRVLQAKDTSVQEAVSAVNATRAFYQRQRQDDAFDTFYESTVAQAQILKIGEPKLPRYRKPPKRFGGSEPHNFSKPKEFFRQQYFAACDLLTQELLDRFEQKDLMQPILAMESVLIKSANGEHYAEDLKQVKQSVFKADLDYDRLEKHLGVLVDVIRQALPEVKKVTSVRTICEAMKSPPYRTMLSEVHKLLRLYLTVPITSSTSERAFSTLRRLLTYLRSSMTEQRLNNCMLLHIHKDLTDDLDLHEIAKEFISSNDERHRYFGNFSHQ